MLNKVIQKTELKSSFFITPFDNRRVDSHVIFLQEKMHHETCLVTNSFHKIFTVTHANF